jgi:hypothetical protein
MTNKKKTRYKTDETHHQMIDSLRQLIGLDPLYKQLESGSYTNCYCGSFDGGRMLRTKSK